MTFMSFEIRDRDLLARIGRLETRSGAFETPTLLPVINPNLQLISPKEMGEEFGCEALITNAYIVKKRFQKEAVERGVHEFLDFNRTIMTDSGAYQILIYGEEVRISNREIVRFQEEIGTDIATILDLPTGWRVSRQYARQTVTETLKRAEELGKIKLQDDIVWVGPVQGGSYLDLVAESARKIGGLPFQIHALGSPTPIMEQYLFDTLVNMIMTSKMNLPIERPLHLFGAGHPFMFALAVALGCDLFDSAAYAIFAREDRYMTETGTARLRELEYFPCSCRVCSKMNPEKAKALAKNERQAFLARHNLHVCFSEIKRIKQAIIEGRLWEHLIIRAHGHPSLLKALNELTKYSRYLEENSPVIKKSGIFFFGSLDLARPEIFRHESRLSVRYLPPKTATMLVLLPHTRNKPFSKSWEHQEALKEIRRKLGIKMLQIHVCTYAAPFGVVPSELDEVYPLSQYETATPLDDETIEYVAEQVAGYVKENHYRKVVFLEDSAPWQKAVASALRRACNEGNIFLRLVHARCPWSRSSFDKLGTVVQAAVARENDTR
jgi:7-cyano-7-deazaguanine tRNA-ribosyltransferase